jgi:hypothetical protein
LNMTKSMRKYLAKIGRRGGTACAAKRTPEERRALAAFAVNKRWERKQRHQKQSKPEPVDDSNVASDSTKQPKPIKRPSSYPAPADQYQKPLLTAQRRAQIDRADARLRGEVVGFAAPY